MGKAAGIEVGKGAGTEVPNKSQNVAEVRLKLQPNRNRVEAILSSQLPRPTAAHTML